jgi:hypothetical protein
MQRGASAGTRDAIPGIFETIAAAMSLLLVQPLLLVLPLAVDLILWLGARITPERVLAPLVDVLDAQPSLEAEALATTVRGMSEQGSLVDLVGFFIPSLASSIGSQNLAAPWARAVIDPGGVGVTLLLVLGFALLGAVGLMTLQVMMARVVRGGPPLGAGAGRMIGQATLRYLGFLAILIPLLVMAVVAGSLVASVLSVINAFLASLVVLAIVVLIFAAAILLTFVVDAIALAEVGPAQAVELSAGVVRRYPWGSIGLLLVSGVSLITIPELVQRIDAESIIVVLVAMLLFAFIATGLALARMQFFADRLRRWRPGQVRSLG